MVAPIAFLRPISLVRSLTDTNITFIIPIAETTKEIPVTKNPIPAIALFIVLNCSMYASAELTAKLSSSPGGIFLATRIIIPTSSFAKGIS